MIALNKKSSKNPSNTKTLKFQQGLAGIQTVLRSWNRSDIPQGLCAEGENKNCNQLNTETLLRIQPWKTDHLSI